MLEVTGHSVLLCSWRYVLLKSSNLSFTLPQGCKWQMQQLRRYLTAKHGFETVQTLYKEIDNIFIRSLLSVQKTIINDKHCFELYGYDILLDQDLKPWECFIFDCLVCQETYLNWMNVEIAWLKKWQHSLPLCRWLIEVNASPSLTASSQEDYDLKYRLLEDTLHIVDMEDRYHLTK